MKTRSSRLSGVSEAVKSLMALASGSRASEPDESFSYFVAGMTIRAVLGYRADATKARTRGSFDDDLEDFAMSVGDVDGISPASCRAERYDKRVDWISDKVENERKFWMIRLAAQGR
jgi:hypothetical protein